MVHFERQKKISSKFLQKIISDEMLCTILVNRLED